MSLSRSKLLKSIIKECILLEAENKIQNSIFNTVRNFRDMLKNKGFSCRINFIQPDSSKRYQDFGSLTVSIDVSVGRTRNMSPKAIASYVRKLADRSNILRYFSFSGPGKSGNILDLEFELKTRYVKYYINNLEEFPIDTNRFEGDRYYLPKNML